jgi:hypothetical protein
MRLIERALHVAATTPDAEVVVQQQNQWVEYDAPLSNQQQQQQQPQQGDPSDAIKALLEMQSRGSHHGQSDIITIGGGRMTE